MEAEAREAAARRRQSESQLNHDDHHLEDDDDDDEDDDDDDDDDQERGFERESDEDTPRGESSLGDRNLGTGNATGTTTSSMAAAAEEEAPPGSSPSLARLRTASSSPELTQMAVENATGSPLRGRQRSGVSVGNSGVNASSGMRVSTMGLESRRRHHGTVSDVTAFEAIEDVASMWRR